MARHPLCLSAFLLVASPALAADVTIQLDAGSGLSVRNSTGAIERLRVDEATGNISRNGALFVHTTGSFFNLFVGHQSGNLTSNSFGSTAFGTSTLSQLTSGSRDTAFGYRALRFNTTGSYNSAVGYRALSGNTSGVNNSAFGGFALSDNNANSNSAFGFNALTSNFSGGNNAAFGNSALRNNTTGSSNSAFGIYALQSNTASNNAAFGAGALRVNTSGFFNTALGTGAMRYNTVGAFNTAVGHYALVSNTIGVANSAFGQRTLNFNSTGTGNTAFGQAALFYNSSGNNNVALGKDAGTNQTTGSDNIYLANAGVAAESGQIKIGTVGTHTRAWIAGIHNIAIPSGSPVFINANGLLGTASVSSARFKEDVRDMGVSSDVLMKLRPVTFRYREDAVADPADAKIPQYGLVAEEVAEVAPELVTADADGRPYTVKYHELPALLLNEVQVQRRTIATLEARIAELEKRPLYTEPREVAR